MISRKKHSNYLLVATHAVRDFVTINYILPRDMSRPTDRQMMDMLIKVDYSLLIEVISVEKYFLKILQVAIVICDNIAIDTRQLIQQIKTIYSKLLTVICIIICKYNCISLF